jgi:hypothetical protein
MRSGNGVDRSANQQTPTDQGQNYSYSYYSATTHATLQQTPSEW